MSAKRNKHGVQAGQVWCDNDKRLGGSHKRQFRILSVDLAFYPSGRAECQLITPVGARQRPVFFARLERFNGGSRGYALVEEADGTKRSKAEPKKKKKKKKKKGSKSKK